MNFIKPDVSTMCMGIAMSMGSLLLVAGVKGKRFSLPNSRILIHQPSAGFEGQSTDIEIQMREILKTRKRMDEIYANLTGRRRRRSTARWSATASSSPTRPSSTASSTASSTRTRPGGRGPIPRAGPGRTAPV